MNKINIKINMQNLCHINNLELRIKKLSLEQFVLIKNYKEYVYNWNWNNKKRKKKWIVRGWDKLGGSWISASQKLVFGRKTLYRLYKIPFI